MPTGRSSRVQWTPEMYWAVREREIARKMELVKNSIGECEAARVVLYNLSETAKIHDAEWEEAQAVAMQNLRRARTQRTQLGKLVANAQDTIRVRPDYAKALSEKVGTILETASKLCEYLDAHGY